MSEHDTFGTLDDPRWKMESDYSAAIASLLQQAAPMLTQEGMKDPMLRMTLQRLTQSLGRPMSAHQRQRVLFLLGRSAAANHDHQRAVGYFEDALGLALDLDDTEAIAESAFALGREHSTLQHFAESVSATEICVIAATAGGGMDADAPPPLLARTAEAMLALATCEYVRAHFDAAQSWLDQADTLIHRLPNSLLAAGSSAANRALIARARGQLEIAQRHALVALDIADLRHEAGLRWARGLVVETTLDLAESLPGGPSRAAGHSLLAMAREYVDIPPRVPRTEGRRGEPPMRLTDAVACLASIRYLRVAGAADVPARLEAIEHVLAHAERHNSSALLGLAYTALGDDLAARHAQSPALRAYELALQAIEGHDMAAIGLRARRALLRYQEGGPDGLDEPYLPPWPLR